MFLNTKRITELINTIYEMVGVLSQLKDPISAVSDCIAADEAILAQLKSEEVIPVKSIAQLQSIHDYFYSFYNDTVTINIKTVKTLSDQIVLLKNVFKEEINAKLNIVFFPYKASMWDSLASVYETAAKDENCVAHVVPIPYYQLTQNKAIITYEGEQFPKDLPIVHYSQYSLEQEQPDIIFVHNVYDQYNTLTRVFDEYFTTNLKKYTDMLVYIPYHVSSFITPQKGDLSLSYNIPTIENVDKIILAGDYLVRAAIKDGIPKEKVLGLGSPKLDSIGSVVNKQNSLPEEWKDKIEGKTVYLLNTGCMHWCQQVFNKLTTLIDIFNITRYVKNSVLIWRPHPLTEISIMKYAPEFYDYYHNLIQVIKKDKYNTIKGIIIDETDDYLPALQAADVIISTDGSLLRSYLLTEKKVMYFDEKMPINSLIPQNAFYYFYNDDEPWYELAQKFAMGYDPLAENRKGIAARVYANVDGTCGEKVYQAIKKAVLQKND